MYIIIIIKSKIAVEADKDFKSRPWLCPSIFDRSCIEAQ